MHSRMVRTAEIIFFSRASRSAGVACRRETVDLADEMGKQGPENVKGKAYPASPNRVDQEGGLFSRRGILKSVELMFRRAF